MQYKGQVEGAYRSYINAARISEDRHYLGKCLSIYSNHEELPFLEIRAVSSIPIEDAMLALSSNETYIRMEGCLALSQHLETRDSDGRIKSFARFIIENAATAESSLSLVTMLPQPSL